MSDQPAVTVLMPVYNAEKYLRQSIESILSQTYKDFEFLIIDDDSTDDSVRIVRSYSDSRITLHQNLTHLGVIDSLNEGLKLSRGEYIVRMDADDVSVPDRIDKLVKFMAQNLQVGICGSWMKIFVRYKFISQTIKTPVDPREIKMALKRENIIQHPTVIMRAKFMKKFKLIYSTKYPHAEDYDLWRRASHFFQLANIPEELVYYRYHPSSVGDLNGSEQAINARKIGGLKVNTNISWKIKRGLARLIAGW